MEKIIKLKKEDIKYLIVHHTATPRDTTRFESVKKYHIEKRGFWDIGYHYFINGKGKVIRGRPEEYVGAHCKTPPPSMNFRSLGICLAGNFEVEKPSEEQLESLEVLLSYLKDKYKVPTENVLGHCEVPYTATLCPGKNLFSWLIRYRKGNREISKTEVLAMLEDAREKINRVIETLTKKCEGGRT